MLLHCPKSAFVIALITALGCQAADEPTVGLRAAPVFTADGCNRNEGSELVTTRADVRGDESELLAVVIDHSQRGLYHHVSGPGQPSSDVSLFELRMTRPVPFVLLLSAQVPMHWVVYPARGARIEEIILSGPGIQTVDAKTSARVARVSWRESLLIPNAEARSGLELTAAAYCDEMDHLTIQ